MSTILGNITPGESTKYANGSSQIRIPVTLFVVHAIGVYLANAFLLLNFGVVYRS